MSTASATLCRRRVAQSSQRYPSFPQDSPHAHPCATLPQRSGQVRMCPHLAARPMMLSASQPQPPAKQGHPEHHHDLSVDTHSLGRS